MGTVLLAMLVDDGKLDWDDKVATHLKGFKLADPLASADVRVRDLVSHRTGLAPHDLLWYRASWGPAESVRRAGLLPLSRPFRSAMQYQSTMFTASGLVAEKAGGRPWADLMSERLFAPLGMADATADPTIALKSTKRAVGHRIDRDGKLKPVPWYVCDGADAAGSVACTRPRPRPVAAAAPERRPARRRPNRVGRAVGRDADAANRRADGPGRPGARPRGQRDELRHGLGRAGLPRPSSRRPHRPDRRLPRQIALFPKDGYGLAVLANAHGTRMNLALIDVLADRLLGLPEKDWHKHYKAYVADEETARTLREERLAQARRADAAATFAAAACVGTYEHEVYGPGEVVATKTGLAWSWRGETSPLEHWEGDTYRVRDFALGDPFLTFDGTEDGRVAGLRLDGRRHLKIK